MRYTDLKITCPVCGEETKNPIYLYQDNVRQAYIKGNQRIQQVLPKATEEERELLLSGICYKCQKKIFTG